MKISLIISLCVVAVIFTKIYFFTFSYSSPESFDILLVGLTISVSLALQVVSSAIIGAGLPLLVRRLGGDPAVAASPAIATAVDITGLIIYFSVATTILNL